MGILRTNERVLEFPRLRPIGDLPVCDWKIRPGQFLAQMDPPLFKTPEGLWLNSVGDGFDSGGMAENFRPDCCTVVRLGELPDEGHPQYKSAFKMHKELVRGDRVMITPYVNRFLEWGGIQQAHIGGLDGDEWLDTSIAKETPDGWMLLGNWVQVRLHNYVKPMPAAYRGRERRTFEDWGTVLAAGPDATVEPGQEVVMVGKGEARPYDCKFFVSPRGPFGDDVVWFREASWQVENSTRRTLEYAVRIVAVKSA